MKLEEIKKRISKKITAVCTEAFILAALLILANHAVGVSFLVFKTPPAPLNWIEIGIDLFFVLIVGAFAVYWMSRLDLERRQAEEKLHELEEMARGMLESAATGIYMLQERKFQYINPLFEEISGFTSDEMIGTYSLDYVHPEDREATRKGAIENLKGQSSAPHEFRLLRKDGHPVWILEKVASIRYRGERAVVGSLMDITEFKQAEEKIKQAAQEWRTTFDSIPDWVSIHDKDFKIVRMNRAFASAFKMEPKELIGKTCYKVVHEAKGPWPNCPLKQTLQTKKPHMVDYFEPHLGIHLEESTSPIFNEEGEVVSVVHVAKDISERKRMEEQLFITDRLASVGELAAGIAHELNNPLTSVIGFSQLLLGRDTPDDVKKDIEVVYSEAQRAAGVVKNLLTFARKHMPVKQLVNINSIIEKVLALRAYEQRVSNIQVITHLTSELPEVMADYFQLQQVYLNIVINAEYFMIEAHHRGTLVITTERVRNTIMTSFADDGPGIAEENLGHVFDPFFTTKEVGRGTGLGLSICHGIVVEHGGRVYTKSKLGDGATFIVELPIS